MATTEAPAPEVRRPTFRGPLVILILAGLALLGAWFWPSATIDFPKRVFLSMVVGLATFTALSLWLMFWSPVRGWWTVALYVPLVALGFAAVRISFDGDMVPRALYFRWAGGALPESSTPAAAPLEVAPASETDYPEYRNRRRDGVVTGPALARDWKARPPREVWKKACGGGYAGFVVVGDAAVTVEQRGGNEVVVCYDARTGEEVWRYAYPANFREPLGGDGPRATPTVAGGRVYALGAAGHLCCLDLGTGKPLWEPPVVNILEGNANIHWGMSGSPLVYDDVVVVNPGTQAAGRPALAAYAQETGRPRWGTGTTKAGYSSPQLATLAGKRQILLLDGHQLGGFDAADGKPLWQFAWPNYQDINVAQPIVLDGDRVFISSGYGKGCAMLRIAEKEGQWSAEPLWQNRSMACKFTSPVLYQGHLYGLDEAILVCVDAATGARKWKDGRYGHGQLLLAGDLLVVLSEKGELVLVEATPAGHRELGKVAALRGEKTWNYPALAGGRAYIRNHREMACFDLRAEAGAGE